MQPHSDANDDLTAYMTMMQPGDNFISLNLASGIASPLDYRTTLVDAEAAHDDPVPPYRLSDALMSLHAQHGAAGRCVLRNIAKAPAQPFARLSAAGFAVVDAALTRQPIAQAAASLTFAEAASLASLKTGLRSIPAFQAFP